MRQAASFWVISLCCAGCLQKVDVGDQPLGGPAPGSEEERATEAVAQRDLPLELCRGADGALGLSGIWAFRIESVSTVSVPGIEPQEEIVTRYGVSQLCQDGLDLSGRVLVCTFSQTRLRDETGACAAQLPSAGLLESLPIFSIAATLNQDAPGATLTVQPWEEAWGVAPGQVLPEEPEGEQVLDAEAIVDTDNDGDPGVTLRGDGKVPTVSWAARLTRLELSLWSEGGPLLEGACRGETSQIILGGPAARALRGRTRVGGEGEARFVRVDGRGGSESLDANGDAELSCGELAALIGSDALPLPRVAGCE